MKRVQLIEKVELSSFTLCGNGEDLIIAYTNDRRKVYFRSETHYAGQEFIVEGDIDESIILSDILLNKYPSKKYHYILSKTLFKKVFNRVD